MKIILLTFAPCSRSYDIRPSGMQDHGKRKDIRKNFGNVP